MNNYEYVKNWRENNKEKVKEYGRTYYEKNKEKIKEKIQLKKEDKKEYSRQYYEANKDNIKKKMKVYRSKNKEKLRIQKKEYRDKNREKVNKAARERQSKFAAKNKEQWIKKLKDIFGELKCVRCGYNKCFVALDFHHKVEHEKEKNIARILVLKPTEERIAEVLKCEILCSNCHRELHSK